jgi:2-iminobutanoate/2-iminopropanoate deaminase
MSAEGKVRITVFLRHDQSKNLDQIDEILYGQGFWSKFPPEGAAIVSWQVLMGIGQVVTLETDADKVRAVNLAVEKMAWGAFRTEFYLSYDFLPVLEKKRAEAARREREGAKK